MKKGQKTDTATRLMFATFIGAVMVNIWALS